MEEQREEGEFVGDCREPMDEAGKGLSLSSKTETLDGEVDVPQQESCIKDANTDSGVCDASGTAENRNDGGSATEDGSLEAGDGNTGNSISDEEQVKADVGGVEEMVGAASSVVEANDNVEKAASSDDVERTDVIIEPEDEKNDDEDAGAVKAKPVDETESSERCDDVQGGSETVKLCAVEMKDETAMSATKSRNGTSHESVEEKESETSAVNEVTDEKAKVEVEDNGGASDAEQLVETNKSQQSSVDGEMPSIAENKDDQEKESTKKSEEDCNKIGVDNKQEKEEKVSVSDNELGNSGCETSDADHKKESTKKSEEDNHKMDVDSEQEKNEEVGLSYKEQGNSECEASDADNEKSEEDNNEMDVDSKHASEENVGLNEQRNPGSETADAKHSESAQEPEESTQFSKGETDKGKSGTVSEVSSAAEICLEEEIANVNQKEENGEAMEIDGVAEEHVEKDDVTVGGVFENAGSESAVASEKDNVPIAASDRKDSKVVKEMETDEGKDNTDMATDPTGKIESADSAIPNSPTENAATGEVEPLDHNALFDPTSDITNFIDFSGVSSWSGNIQDLKTETGNVSLKEDKKSTDMAEEVATVDCNETLKSVDATVNAEGIENESNEARDATDCPKEASDAILGSEDNQDNRDHQFLDKKTVDQQDTMTEEDDITHEAPSIDPNQKEDTEMEENPNNSDYADDGTDSDIKTNGVKRKADVLSEDSPGEGRKTVSFAKVSFAQRPSFKIGACIARAASQMAGSPSVLKGSNFSDETLSVETFVSQLHCAATNPVKENVVSEIAAGFFLDFRNSSAFQQVTLEKVSSKRGRPSNSDAGRTEAFEFEEMGDTYWTDRVIHNGGEEQTPPTEKANYQVVPVELKPAQVQRTRRPYKRRQSQISIPLSASEKLANFDENAPAELIMSFSEADTIPSEKSLSKMFRHFGAIRESQTEVDKENNRARVVYRKGTDAEVAYNSAGRFNIFGTKVVNYELSHTITETFKVQPYVVSIGEEDAALSQPS